MKMSNLRQHRMIAGLTQEELAKCVGMHRVSINELETGKRSPRPRTIKKLADALGVDARKLMSSTDLTKRQPGE